MKSNDEPITTEVSKLAGNKKVVASGRTTNGFIHDVEVDPGYRRRGLATEIIHELMMLGGEKLWVRIGNYAAISLYNKAGFKIAKEDGGFYLMSLMKDGD